MTCWNKVSDTFSFLHYRALQNLIVLVKRCQVEEPAIFVDPCKYRCLDPGETRVVLQRGKCGFQLHWITNDYPSSLYRGLEVVEGRVNITQLCIVNSSIARKEIVIDALFGQAGNTLIN